MKGNVSWEELLDQLIPEELNKIRRKELKKRCRGVCGLRIDLSFLRLAVDVNMNELIEEKEDILSAEEITSKVAL